MAGSGGIKWEHDPATPEGAAWLATKSAKTPEEHAKAAELHRKAAKSLHDTGIPFTRQIKQHLNQAKKHDSLSK